MLFFQMPRSYKRKTNKAAWSADQISNALAAIESGRPLRQVARCFGIPRTSLQSRFKNKKIGGPALGRSAIFNKQNEEMLALHVIKLGKLFHGVSRSEIKKCAFEFAEKNNKKHPFNKDSKSAGEDWLKGFMKRNPTITLRKPEATSINRISAFNREEVSLFYSNLQKVQEKFNFSPTRIFNMDETGISSVQVPTKILAQKGQKQVGFVTSWERGKNITVICAFSASGTYVPPMFIFNRKRMNQQLQKGGPPGSFFSCSDKGWITDILFLDWLQHFQKFVKSSSADPVLLVMDNHVTHCTLQAFNFCKANGIVLLTIPPHTSHRLQPLDVTFYGPLKIAYNVECSKYLKSHPFQKITPFEIAELFNNAYGRVATPEKALKGFKVTGIFPLNPDNFTEEDFAASDLQNFNLDPVIPGVVLPDPAIRPRDHTTPDPMTAPINVSFEEILPLPGPSRPNTAPKRKAKKQHSEIITHTPNKITLEDKENKKKIRKENKRMVDEKKLKKQFFTESENQEDIGQKLQLSRKCKTKPMRKQSSSSSGDFSADDDENGREINDDLCLVCGEFGKNREMWLRCIICSSWAHKACTDTEKNQFICDFCA